MKKVVYESKDGYQETHHPALGALVSGVPFELPDDQANAYIKSGLLSESRDAKKTAPKAKEE